ncbi:MAG: amidase [Armatimonadota bacterium]|nr:amidase [Armatimonadota bacterium]MDR5702076.1 amidase [Armatimonadota bacterium]MDR7434601.1 amidase [Armatimonadota bacterium]
MRDPWDLSLHEAAKAIASRQLSSRDLVRSLLDRIERLEPQIQAWARLRPEEALVEAEELDRRLAREGPLGPLHGVPIGVKDIFYTAGWETSAGSRILAGFLPAFDATVVARLKSKGAIILGKTVTTEFATFDPGPTRNPWNLRHTPGGSSSGSAAAVAARMCPGAFGTQTAGSILRPAAFCGIVGLKPSYGRISRHGVVPVSWTLDHPGPMGRTVQDVAILLEATAGPDGYDTTCLEETLEGCVSACERPASGLRVGVPDRFFLERSTPEMVSAYRRALPLLEEAGMEVREIHLPPEFDDCLEAHRTIMYAEAAAFHQRWFRDRSDEYGPKIRAMIEEGLRIPAVSYLRARETRTACIQAMKGLFAEVDLLVTPTTPGPAPEGLASTGDPIFNLPFTFLGFPAMTVPAGLSPSGLPLGIQLVARPLDEVTLLRAAAAYERVNPWRELRPPEENLKR